jgi:tetratricopeptide (TPR) repeat protein
VHVAHHVDFLQFFGSPDTDLVLDRGLAKFPASALLHERLRTRLLERGGVDALVAAYDQKLQAADAPPALAWFAGYARMVAAEMHRKHQKPDLARAAYDRAIDLFTRYRATSGNQDGEHYVAMAHGGIARLLLQNGDRAGAFAALQHAFAGPAAAIAATDGLGVTTMQTAEMLRGNARDAKDEALLQQLEAALQRLPPEAFELPEYERASRGQGGQRNRPRRG